MSATTPRRSTLPPTRPRRASSGSRRPSPGIAGGPTLEAWLGEATETMLDLAAVGAGARVLDVAAGAGGQTLSAARRVGTDGAVLATDLAPAILDFAEREARAAGLTNVAVRAMDAEALDLEPGTLRCGDLPARAHVPARRCPPRWRACAARWLPAGGWPRSSSPRPTATASSACRWASSAGAPDSAPPVAGQPGPFSLGASGVLAGALSAAGFGAVEVRALDAPLRLPTAADCLRFQQESFGALHQMLSGLDDAGRAAAWDEVARPGATSRGPTASRARASCWWSARPPNPPGRSPRAPAAPPCGRARRCSR